MNDNVTLDQDWAYTWNKSLLSSKENYSVVITNKRLLVNIIYTYPDLLKLSMDGTADTMVPREVIKAVLKDYPLRQTAQADRIAV